jgi:uncharacterized protein YacL
MEHIAEKLKPKIMESAVIDVIIKSFALMLGLIIDKIMKKIITSPITHFI